MQLRADGEREKKMVDNWPDPPPIESDQIRTETLLSGLTNGTERNGMIGGNYAPSESSLPTGGGGYQNVGRIIEIGSDIKDLEVGDTVYSSSGHYQYCNLRPHNFENLMPHQYHDGLLIKLDNRVDLTQAALFGVSSVAMRCCRNADLRMGQRFLVVGAGMVGQMAAQIGNAMGARVSIADIDQRRLDIAYSTGLVENVVNVSGKGWQQIQDANFDTILDVAGVVGMEDQLIGAAKHGGLILLIAGRFKVEYTFNLGQHKEINIKQNSHFDKDDLTNLQRLTARGELNIAPLIKDVVSIASAQQIYDRLRDQPQELLGTVFDWR